MKKIGIYKITNNVSGHIYIGLSRNLTKRFYNHKWHLRRGSHRNNHLQNAWNKYGENAFIFEIIEECDETELNQKELYWINYYGGYENPNLYNLRDGGDSMKQSKETIEKIRKSNLGNPCYWKGKHLPEDMKQKISQNNKGRKLTSEQRKNAANRLKDYWKDKTPYWTGKTITEEHRQKLRESHLGQKSWNKGNRGMISEETRKKLRESHLGHYQSAEVRAKISAKNKGKQLTLEQRKKLSIANMGQRRNWLYKDGIETTVPPEKVEEYLAQGWTQGRLDVHRVWINNGVDTKRICEKDLLQYIESGWKKGRIYASRNLQR